MTPKTMTEQLMYSTIRLETATGSGTGFIFAFDLGDEKKCPMIITNKHVLGYKNNTPVKFLVHTNLGDDGTYSNYEIDLTADWFFHETHDLCFAFFQPIIEAVKKGIGKNVCHSAIEDKCIWDTRKLGELSVVEDVTMIGYPNGLWDEKNNFPIFRSGHTATHPAIGLSCTVDGIEYNDGIGMTDIPSFGGSSGSPVFIRNEGSYNTRDGSMHFGVKRIILLGVLFAVPLMNAQGRIEKVNTPNNQTRVSHTPFPINLGYYIHASKIFDFKQTVLDCIKSKPQLAINFISDNN